MLIDKLIQELGQGCRGVNTSLCWNQSQKAASYEEVLCTYGVYQSPFVRAV